MSCPVQLAARKQLTHLCQNRCVFVCALPCSALAKEDGIESLTTRADSYAKRVRWVNANREAIVAAVKDKMLALATAAA